VARQGGPRLSAPRPGAPHAELIVSVAARLRAAGLPLPPGLPAPLAPLAPPGAGLDGAALAARIDHTLLRADATAADIDRLCDEACEHGFAAVCVNPLWVARAAARVAAPVRVCSVADFPLGAGTTELRAREAERAVLDGAQEVDVVIRVGTLREALPASARSGAGVDARDAADRLDEGALRAVHADLAVVVAAVRGAGVSLPSRQRVIKVILETGLLDERQKVAGALLAAAAGADMVKTCTGFAGSATEDDVRLLRATLGRACGIKASGGIRTRSAALALLAAGADRLGCSASVAIVKEGRPGRGA